jgi:POT family proton-dependent oligopeptide transporter
MTPLLLVRWKQQAAVGRERSPLQKMAAGAMIVAASYLLLAAASALYPGGAHWVWIVAFFVVLTLGELYILPTGLGLFARLAPPRLGATTVAAWYLAIFTGSLTAGVVGSWYSQLQPPWFFAVLAGIAIAASGILLTLDRRGRAVEAARIADRAIERRVAEGLPSNA